MKEDKKGLVIGIIGQAGSGKTTFTRNVCNQLDGLHIEGDIIGHDILRQEEVIKALQVKFGHDIMSNQEIDRQKLGEIVFSSKDKLDFLNQLTHPLIKDKIQDIIRGNKSKYRYILVEGAALIEASIHLLCDRVIYLYAPEGIRLNRLVEGRKLKIDKANQIIEAQMKEAYYQNYADISFDTSRDEALDDFLAYLKNLLK